MKAGEVVHNRGGDAYEVPTQLPQHQHRVGPVHKVVQLEHLGL